MKEKESEGVRLLAKGHVATVVLAGGMGSRLRVNGPKGCVPIGRFSQKTLFARLCERVKAASACFGAPLEIAFMTSPLNDGETRSFFKRHHFFGLKEQQVHFFTQSLLPFLDEEHRPLPFLAPCGNGEVFSLLVKTPFWQKWCERGVRFITTLPIDNPLADPFDAFWIGLGAQERSDVVIKAVKRADPSEKMGVIVQKEGKTLIAEYSELTDAQREDLITYPLANSGLFCFDVDFVKKAASTTLPYHYALKEVQEVHSAWKREQFIFDAFTVAERISFCVAEREECFAPLKNFEGADSLNTVMKALLECDGRVYRRFFGEMPPKEIELSLAFHYPTRALYERWQGKVPQEGYIEGCL